METISDALGMAANGESLLQTLQNISGENINENNFARFKEMVILVHFHNSNDHLDSISLPSAQYSKQRNSRNNEKCVQV